jgi:hypothetical protein
LKTQIPKISELQEEIAIIKLSQYPANVSAPDSFESTIPTYGCHYTKHIERKEEV